MLIAHSVLLAILAIGLPISGDQVVYKYDALGRLSHACTASASQGERTDYQFDAASNRTNYLHIQTALTIEAGSSVASPDGRFHLTMQTDGNLVHYGPTGALWGSNTVGSGASVASFQPDGNLVLYRSDGVPVWSTGTSAYLCANMSIQNDGNVVIVNMEGVPVWATNTGGH